MSAQERDNREIRALLPFYVTGALDRDEREAVEAARDADPAIAREIAELEVLARGVEAAEAEIEAEMVSPAELGLKRLEREIAKDEAQQAQDAVTRHGIEPFRLKGPRLPQLRRLAAAASLALVLGLGAGSFFTYQFDERYQAAGGGVQQAEGAVLQVFFRAGATEAEIAALLRAEGLEIVGGPSALGLYRVATGLEPGSKALTALTARLESEDAVVEQVAVE